MFRSMLAIAAGYITMAVLNGFTHLIVSIYFKTGISLTGIARLPSGEWVIMLTILQLFFGLFGGLFTTTLARSNQRLVIVGFILLIAATGLIDYTILESREPLWYLILSPALKVTGIYAGYKLYFKQNNKTAPAQ